MPQRPGAYLLRAASGDLAVAVNVPPEESDPLLVAEDFPYERLVSKQPPPRVEKGQQVAPSESRSFWWALLITVCFLMLGEIILANRTTL